MFVTVHPAELLRNLLWITVRRAAVPLRQAKAEETPFQGVSSAFALSSAASMAWSRS